MYGYDTLVSFCVLKTLRNTCSKLIFFASLRELSYFFFVVLFFTATGFFLLLPFFFLITFFFGGV
jgi:hypothetical protein